MLSSIKTVRTPRNTHAIKVTCGNKEKENNYLDNVIPYSTKSVPNVQASMKK